MRRIVSSESVTGGHPDKLCDQVSDGVLDAILAQDPSARVAVECAAKDATFFVFGEISSSAYVDVREVVRDVLYENGYQDAELGVSAESVGVLSSISRQSADIALGVDRDDPLAQGAGDQGMMIGYATDETPDLMPLPLSLARDLTRRLTSDREDGLLPWLRPDGKAQVSIAYEGDKPVEITSVVISAQHADEVSIDEVRIALELLAAQHLPDALLSERTAYHFNPTGRFVIGGPAADSGLTGRKIIVDTYGGAARHGGGAFSGKDPSKVDRTGAYAARWLAKSIVASRLAPRAEVELAYAIGVADPVAVAVNTFGAADDEALARRLVEAFDLRPGAIVAELGLREIRYRNVARNGHFGRAADDAPWEQEVKL